VVTGRIHDMPILHTGDINRTEVLVPLHEKVGMSINKIEARTCAKVSQETRLDVAFL
jgi:hypothetical protein